MPDRAGRLAILLLLQAQAALAGAQWIQDPARPGEDIPPVGQSRFDDLFVAGDGSLAIPYPFGRLVEFLETRVDNGGEPAVRQAFVPMGRSLQRDTAAPDYFRYPRRVIAVEGEPAGNAAEAGRVMEYRLFIAHQPSTQTLEIISYNDAAARFEFQLVDNYDASGEPRLRAANRVMCLSCHHNAAPIFAGNPWSETSFNFAIAERLARALPDRFASPIDVLSIDAGVIDVLAERANYLAAVQFVWRQGCPSPACRAAMLRAALQYRLSSKTNFDREDRSYRRDYFAALSRQWRSRWPRGLALAGSRIADRDPLADATPNPGQDPLLPRPPQATWHTADATLAAGVVFRLGGFFTLADIRRLDRQLQRLARESAAPRIRYRADCRIQPKDGAVLRLVCGNANGRQGLRATLDVEYRQQAATAVDPVSIQLPGDPNLWQPEIRQLSSSASGISASFGDRRGGLSQRLANGDRLVSMRLRWQDFPAADAASLVIEVSREFAIFDRALQRLLDSDPGDRFADVNFSREAVLRPLMRELGMTPLAWSTAQAPAAAQPRAVRQLSGGLALLAPYCGHCHAGEGAHPPGFLSAYSAPDSLARCAPRMLARVAAWQPAGELQRAPMPPPVSIAYSGVSAADWPASAHYRALLSSLQALVEAEYGAAARERWRQADYALLPRCDGGFSE